MNKIKFSRLFASLFALSLVVLTIACGSEDEDEDEDKGIVSIPYAPNEEGFRPADKEEFYQQMHILIENSEGTEFVFPHTRVAFKQTYNGEGSRYIESNIALGIKAPKFSDTYEITGKLRDLTVNDDTWEMRRSLPYYNADEDREVRSLNMETEKETGLETAVMRTYKTDITVKTNEPYYDAAFTISIEMPISIKTPSGNTIKIPIDESNIFDYLVSLDFDEAIYKDDDPNNPFVEFTYRIGVRVLEEESWAYAQFTKRFEPKQ